MPLSCALKNNADGEFYVKCILPPLKKAEGLTVHLPSEAPLCRRAAFLPSTRVSLHTPNSEPLLEPLASQN